MTSQTRPILGRQPAECPETLRPQNWCWSIENPVARNLVETLLDIQEQVPCLIQERHGVAVLPFPPKLLMSITDSEVLYISDCFHYYEVGRYDNIERLYYHLNRHFIEQDSLELAGRLIKSTRWKLPSDVPLAPVLLLLGAAYLSEHDARPQYLSERREKKRRQEELRTRVRKPLEAAVEAFSSIQILEGLSREPPKEAILRAIAEIDKVIDAHDKKEFWQDFVFGSDVPRNFVSDASGARIFQVGDGLWGFLEQTWRPYGAKKLARELLQMWRVPVTENARLLRVRNKKKGGRSR